MKFCIRIIKYYLLVYISFMTFEALADNNVNAIDDNLSSNEDVIRVWNFNATLDGDPIGSHRFEVIENKYGVTVKTKAELDVKFLFITVYSYKHNNVEEWTNDCLVSLNSDTDDNGDMSSVELLKEGHKSRITTQKSSVLESSCVRSFSYWDRELLKSGALLNSQTGEIINVDFTYIGSETLDINDRKIESDRYQLLGKDKDGIDIEIDLWYSDNNRWIGLQSKLENGSYLRYQLDPRVL